jgi:prefoldin beta subunit
MDAEIPKQLQDKIMQFQNLQGQMQMVAMQKQQLFMQAADNENALKALEETKEGTKIYKAAGQLVVETNKADTEKKLKEDKDLVDAKMKMMEKQEKKLSEKLEELRAELQTMMKPTGGAGTGG